MTVEQYPGGCTTPGQVPTHQANQPFTEGQIDYRPADECSSGWMYQDRTTPAAVTIQPAAPRTSTTTYPATTIAALATAVIAGIVLARKATRNS